MAVKEGLLDDDTQAVTEGVKVLLEDSEGVALRQWLVVELGENVPLAEDVGVAGKLVA